MLDVEGLQGLVKGRTTRAVCDGQRGACMAVPDSDIDRLPHAPA